MQIIQALPLRFEKSGRRPTRPRRSDAVPPRRREVNGGGTQDRALYSCGCGYAFTAEVSTSVSCPHCRSAQAW